MKIYFASDHAGFEMKGRIVDFAKELGFETEDLGPWNFDPSDDYPTLIAQAAGKVSQDPDHSKAIILGKSGQGEAITANRFPNVRAAVFYGGDLEIIKLAREHNDANVLSLGAGMLSFEEAREAVRLWLHTDFSNEERHSRRIKLIDNLND